MTHLLLMLILSQDACINNTADMQIVSHTTLAVPTARKCTEINGLGECKRGGERSRAKYYESHRLIARSVARLSRDTTQISP